MYFSLVSFDFISSQLYAVNYDFARYFTLSYFALRLLSYSELRNYNYIFDTPSRVNKYASRKLHNTMKRIYWGHTVTAAFVASVCSSLLDVCNDNELSRLSQVSSRSDDNVLAIFYATLILLFQVFCAKFFISEYKSCMVSVAKKIHDEEITADIYDDTIGCGFCLKRCFQGAANKLNQYGLFDHDDLDFLVIKPDGNGVASSCGSYR